MQVVLYGWFDDLKRGGPEEAVSVMVDVLRHEELGSYAIFLI